MTQDLDQILLLIGGVLGGGFALIFLLAWMEPTRLPEEPRPVREPWSFRVLLARMISAASGSDRPVGAVKPPVTATHHAPAPLAAEVGPEAAAA